MKKLVRLFVPGSFEDAQLYMGHLVVFTTDRDVRMLELESLTRKLENRYPDWLGAMTLAFARNDWLHSSAVKSIAANRSFADALNAAFDGLASSELALATDDFALTPLRGFSQEADVVLDTVLYAERLYMGTTSGFYDYDINWQSLSVARERKRLDARCVSATAEYGAVNASCESDGLFTGYDEFGWRHHLVDGNGELDQTAQRSMRSAWYGTDLVNYESPTAPELLAAEVEDVERAGGYEGSKRKVVTRFDAPTDDLKVSLKAALEAQRDIAADDVQFVWNSSRAFFINTYSHGFYSAVRTQNGVRLTKHGTTEGRVVAVHRYSGGWIVETDFGAYVLAQGSLIALIDEEPLSVRAFEGSKRYRRIVAITVGDGVHLISVVDDF